MATYLKSLGLVEIITVIYGESCFKVHYQTPLQHHHYNQFHQHHHHVTIMYHHNVMVHPLFGLDLQASNYDFLFFSDVPSLSRSYSSRANYPLKSSLKNSSSRSIISNYNNRRHQDTISSSPDNRYILHSQNSSPDRRRGVSMRSTSNQSSDGGSYSDLIHGDQGNTYTTTSTTATTTYTTTTTTTNNRKVVKHGSFILRKTVKRE